MLTETSLFSEVAMDDASFLQLNQEPPSTWEGDYKKSGEESNGVISMIDLLIRDLSKEMTEAEVEEQNAQRDYEEFMADSAKKRAKDTKAMSIKDAGRADAEQMKLADVTAAREEKAEMMATVQYQGQVHKECDWLLQNFDLRRQARAEEMDNLKKAKAVLSGADFSFLQVRRKATFLTRS